MGERIMSLTLMSKMSSADKGTLTLGISPDVLVLDRFAAVDKKAGCCRLRRSTSMANEESRTPTVCPARVTLRLIGSTTKEAKAPHVSTLRLSPWEMASSIGSPFRNTPYILVMGMSDLGNICENGQRHQLYMISYLEFLQAQCNTKGHIKPGRNDGVIYFVGNECSVSWQWDNRNTNLQ